MGICSSCLGSRDDSDEAERARLLADDPYAQPHPNYSGWQQQQPPQPHSTQSPEDQAREQEAMHNIMRWASDQIVEIFPVNPSRVQHQTQLNAHNSHNHNQTQSTANMSMNSSVVSLPPQTDGMTNSTHQDILLSMIPGDKSKRSIRIYPASRPSSQDAQSVRSKASQTKLNGSVRSARRDGSSVFVKLNIDLP